MLTLVKFTDEIFCPIFTIPETLVAIDDINVSYLQVSINGFSFGTWKLLKQAKPSNFPEKNDHFDAYFVIELYLP